MNPLASTKCAGRLLMALTAIASILLIASCGSVSSLTTPNREGFGDGNLSGTYVISISGTDVNSSSFIVVSAFPPCRVQETFRHFRGRQRYHALPDSSYESHRILPLLSFRH